ncbi:MAG: hypothetical protein ACYC0P_06790 [Thiobacillus sp.]
MNGLPAIQGGSGVDLVRDSIEQVLAVSFPKSRSAAYSAAVNIAQQADKYGEVDMNGTLFHYAAFGSDREQVGRALAITRYLDGIKAVQFYAGGKLIVERLRIESVLTCYLEACACKDPRAHCNKIVAHPFGADQADDDHVNLDLGSLSKPSGYLFPCAFLLQWGPPGLHRRHPASPEDQIQAMAVRKGCDWCPNFHPEQFQTL